MEREFEAAREILIDGLRLLIEIAARREGRLAQKKLVDIYTDVDTLSVRANQNRLPVQTIGIILNDARLESLILLADMKVDILYDHQEAMAPTQKLRTEVRSHTQDILSAETDEVDPDHLSSRNDIGQIQLDLQIIHAIEESFHMKTEEP
jgi:hypothetical protein